MKIVRDHDRLYLNQDHKSKPKEYFKYIAAHVRPYLSRIRNAQLLDVGCAGGDFLYYLSRQFPEARLTGLDVMPDLLAKAKKELPAACFLRGSIVDARRLPRGRFDAVFMNGVHPIFDDCRPWIKNTLSLTNKGGRVYVFGIFNPDDSDVLIKTRYSTLDNDQPWQSGWNLFSKKTVGLHLKQFGVRYRFMDWNISVEIKKIPNDPWRSWTFRLGDGSLGIQNGMQLLHTFSLLEIRR